MWDDSVKSGLFIAEYLTSSQCSSPLFHSYPPCPTLKSKVPPPFIKCLQEPSTNFILDWEQLFFPIQVRILVTTLKAATDNNILCSSKRLFIHTKIWILCNLHIHELLFLFLNISYFFSHTVILSIQTFLHAGTPYKESLVWFQACLCHTINAGPLLGFFYTSYYSPVSWRSYSPGSKGLNHFPIPPMLQQITDEVDVGFGQHITLFLGLGSCRFVSPPALLCFCH